MQVESQTVRLYGQGYGCGVLHSAERQTEKEIQKRVQMADGKERVDEI